MNFCVARCRKVWTFQAESRKKARKLIVERLIGSSPFRLPIVEVLVIAGQSPARRINEGK
jgi:hypothetical protein